MIKYWSTPKIAGRIIATALTEPSTATGGATIKSVAGGP
jgi:hypothetical protein